MKSKLKILIPLVVVVALAGYKLAFAGSTPPPKPKVEGQVYVLPKDFLINLEGGRFAKLDVGLVLAAEQEVVAHGTPPEGFGPLEQEAVVRDIITDALTGAPASALIDEAGRARLKARLLDDIRRRTDVKVEHVLFTGVTVQ